MKKYLLIALLALSSPIAFTGCDKKVAETEKTTTSDTGVKTEKKEVTESPNGTITEKKSESVDTAPKPGM